MKFFRFAALLFAWLPLTFGPASAQTSSAPVTVDSTTKIVRDPAFWPANRPDLAKQVRTPRQAAGDGVDSRLLGLTDPTGKIAIYSTYNVGTSTYTPNTSFWGADLDWSGVAVKNSANLDGTGGNRGGVTMISPRHYITANHFNIANGTTVTFRASDGALVTRTISNSVQIGSTDIRVGILSSDLPATVAYYSILPDEYLTAFTMAATSTRALPLVGLNQSRTAYVREWVFNYGFADISHLTPGSAPRSTFSGSFITGDSGQPLFLIQGKRLVLLGAHFGTTSFPGLVANVSAINTAMSSLGGSYQLSRADWTEWLRAGDLVFTTGSTTNFLREDGQFSPLGGQGDLPEIRSGYSEPLTGNPAFQTTGDGFVYLRSPTAATILDTEVGVFDLSPGGTPLVLALNSTALNKRILGTDASGNLVSVALAAGQSMRLNAAGTALEAFTPGGGTLPFSSITGTPTTLAGYGITDGLTTSAAAAAYQPLDADLTAIAALTTATAGRSLLTLSSVPAGALVGTTDTQALTGKTISGLTVTTTTGTLTLATGKTFTASNTLTLAGTDGSTLNVGAGGTLGTAAFTAATAYEVPLTFSTGLTRSTNTVTVNTAQNIATLSNLTSNGFVKTSGGTGALSIDTSTYLTTTSAASTYQPLDAALTALAGGSDFVAFSGPATSTKTFTLPNASSTLLYDAGPLGTPASGTLTNATGLPAAGLTASAGSVLFGRYTGTAGAGQQITIGSGLTLNSGTGVLSSTGGGTIASTSSVLKGDGAGNAVAATAGTDFAGISSTNTFTGANTFARGTITTSSPLALTQTWNASGVTFKGLSLTITDTASASGSLPVEVLGGSSGATTLFSVSKAGKLTAGDPGGFNPVGLNLQFGSGVGAIIQSGGTASLQLNGSVVGIQSLGLTSNAANSSPGVYLSLSATGIAEINNGSTGTYRDLLARGLRSSAVTFSNAISSPVEGTVQAFTDSTTATWGATITGGGSNHVLGYYNGTNWTVAAK